MNEVAIFATPHKHGGSQWLNRTTNKVSKVNVNSLQCKIKVNKVSAAQLRNLLINHNHAHKINKDSANSKASVKAKIKLRIKTVNH